MSAHNSMMNQDGAEAQTQQKRPACVSNINKMHLASGGAGGALKLDRRRWPSSSSSSLRLIVITTSLVILLLVVLVSVHEVDSCGGGGGGGGKGGGKKGFGGKKEKFGWKKEKFGKKKMKAVRAVGSSLERHHHHDDDYYEPRVARRHHQHYEDDESPRYVVAAPRPSRRRAVAVVPVEYHEYEPVAHYSRPREPTARANRVYVHERAPYHMEEAEELEYAQPVVRGYERSRAREPERPSLRRELGKALLRAVAA